jgi:hypothetical protein
MLKGLYLFIVSIFSCVYLFSQEKSNEKDKDFQWSLSCNLTSIIRKQKQYFFDERTIFPTSNQLFTIAPELKFHNNFSCRFPVSIGIKRIKNATEVEGYYPGVGFGYNAGWESYIPYDVTREPYYNSAENAVSPNSGGHGVGHGVVDDVKARPMDLIWQIGICPKLYIAGTAKICNPYFAVSINLAYLDKYRIDCYNTFAQGQEYWEFKDQISFVYSNPFYAVRREFIFGLDFRLNKKIRLDWEFGYSPFVKKAGKNLDRIYYSYEGGENILIDQIYKNDDYQVMDKSGIEMVLNGKMFTHLLLRYSF